MKRPKLSYANVMATVAVFIALGGGAYAATQIPKNGVGTKQLKNGAVTGAKVAKNAITGEKVDLSTLGTVPSAASAINAENANNALHAATADSATSANHATSADSATTATHATTADSATIANMTHADSADLASVAQEVEGVEIGCPAGTTLIGGICFDSALKGPVTGYKAAADACAADGGYLPSPALLYPIRGAINLGTGVPPNFAVSDSFFADPVSKSHYSTIVVYGSAGTMSIIEAEEEVKYICAYSLVR